MDHVKTILVIEDNQVIQGAYAIKLKEYNLIFVKNGKEGMNILEKITPDLIILDILLPIMNGKEFLSAVKKVCPIVIITNCIDEIDTSKVDKVLYKMEANIQSVYDVVTSLL